MSICKIQQFHSTTVDFCAKTLLQDPSSEKHHDVTDVNTGIPRFTLFEKKEDVESKNHGNRFKLKIVVIKIVNIEECLYCKTAKSAVVLQVNPELMQDRKKA